MIDYNELYWILLQKLTIIMVYLGKDNQFHCQK